MLRHHMSQDASVCGSTILSVTPSYAAILRGTDGQRYLTAQYDASKRITARDALQHPFFKHQIPYPEQEQELRKMRRIMIVAGIIICSLVFWTLVAFFPQVTKHAGRWITTLPNSSLGRLNQISSQPDALWGRCLSWSNTLDRPRHFPYRALNSKVSAMAVSSHAQCRHTPIPASGN